MLFTLRPLVLESGGLVAALEHLAGKMRETYGENVVIQAGEGAAADLEVGKQGVIFSIAEEAMNNARKHAKAKQIRARVWRKGDLFFLEVADDGVGFDVREVDAGYEARGSLGMVNLRERAELVNGVLRIDSAPGKGTRVALTCPLTEDAAERLHRPGFAA
jgi:signal transduction histidine kinase